MAREQENSQFHCSGRHAALLKPSLGSEHESFLTDLLVPVSNRIHTTFVGVGVGVVVGVGVGVGVGLGVGVGVGVCVQIRVQYFARP